MFIQILTPSFRYFSTSFIYITIKEEKGYTIYLRIYSHTKKQELYYNNSCKIHAGKHAENTDAAFPKCCDDLTYIM